jgi:hypothetical protein
MDRDNVVADALSRKIEDLLVPLQEGQLMLFTFPNLTLADDIKDNYLQDPVLHQLLLDLQNGINLHPKYSLRSGLLLYKGILYVGPFEYLRTQILNLVHDSLVAGHSGYQKNSPLGQARFLLARYVC